MHDPSNPLTPQTLSRPSRISTPTNTTTKLQHKHQHYCYGATYTRRTLYNAIASLSNYTHFSHFPPTLHQCMQETPTYIPYCQNASNASSQTRTPIGTSTHILGRVYNFTLRWRSSPVMKKGRFSVVIGQKCNS